MPAQPAERLGLPGVRGAQIVLGVTVVLDLLENGAECADRLVKTL
jgi:hypothetical protein